MRTTASLLGRAGRADLLRARRRSIETLTVDGQPVMLKDQRPLIEANAALAPGWTFGDFVEYLNCHVFFWPGREGGPIGPGCRLLEHYEAEGPAVLRVPTAKLFEKNGALVPLFCPFNSGAPRYNAGKPAKRGPDLFVPAGEFPRRATQVVELAFRGDVRLPVSASVQTPGGWTPL